MLSIQKKSLVDMVYDKLRESIIQLQLPLGSKLNVNELRDRMGVSCTPIREAINRLQQEGLVVYENNVGAHIISLAPHDVIEIQQLGMTLHGAAIHLAIQGQQLLLRYIYASCIPQRAADIEILQQMLLDTMNGDADAVCTTLQTYSDQMTRVVETAVTEL